jgi:tRNA(Ile)-lysidine synthase
MSALVRQFQQQWAPYSDQLQILIACSGGPDSVALLRLLLHVHPHREGLSVAHFNHRLRGSAADDDARFVDELCQKFHVPCQIGQADPERLRAKASGEGIESAARQLRYAFLVEQAQQRGARYLVTGHTADDHIETVLHHILRGTGLAGLAGIPSVRPLSPAVTLLRPLLGFWRTEIVEYLRQEGQTYCVDQHNTQPQFTRSRIRHELLPLLERDYAPAVRDSLTKLARVAADAQAIIQDHARRLLERSLVAQPGASQQLDCSALQLAPDHLRREAFVLLWQQQGWPLQSMTFNHWQQLAEIVAADAADTRIHLPGSIQVQRRGNRLSMEKHA